MRDVQGELDQLSLEQALIDFEVANRRVIDLTQRLLKAERALRELKAESIGLRRLRRVLYLTGEARRILIARLR